MKRFHFDNILVSVCLSLLLIGYIMVTSSSLHLGAKMSGDILHYPIRQIAHISFGLFLGCVVCMMSLRTWENLAPKLFIAGLGFLIIVLIPGLGVKVNGSIRWLSLGGIRIQVSEIVKLFSVVYLAKYITQFKDIIEKSQTALFKPLGLFGFASFLLLLEPDFGSSVVIFMIAMGMMFLAGARLLQFVGLVVFLATVAIIVVYLSPYRWQRVTSFMDPWADALGSGFQLVQALISFGRGDLTGVGLGNGIQKLFYLPEAHTDFLFSVIAEELGLLGVIVIIALFALLVWRSFVIGSLAEKMDLRFAAFIAYGLGIWFGFQAFVNMGVNMGLLPTKGLTLPLMSYGGGSMMVMCCAIGLLFRIYNEVAKLRANQPKGRWYE